MMWNVWWVCVVLLQATGIGLLVPNVMMAITPLTRTDSGHLIFLSAFPGELAPPKDMRITLLTVQAEVRCRRSGCELCERPCRRHGLTVSLLTVHLKFFMMDQAQA